MNSENYPQAMQMNSLCKHTKYRKLFIFKLLKKCSICKQKNNLFQKCKCVVKCESCKNIFHKKCLKNVLSFEQSPPVFLPRIMQSIPITTNNHTTNAIDESVDMTIAAADHGDHRQVVLQNENEIVHDKWTFANCSFAFDFEPFDGRSTRVSWSMTEVLGTRSSLTVLTGEFRFPVSVSEFRKVEPSIAADLIWLHGHIYPRRALDQQVDMATGPANIDDNPRFDFSWKFPDPTQTIALFDRQSRATVVDSRPPDQQFTVMRHEKHTDDKEIRTYELCVENNKVAGKLICFSNLSQFQSMASDNNTISPYVHYYSNRQYTNVDQLRTLFTLEKHVRRIKRSSSSLEIQTSKDRYMDAKVSNDISTQKKDNFIYICFIVSLWLVYYFFI